MRGSDRSTGYRHRSRNWLSALNHGGFRGRPRRIDRRSPGRLIFDKGWRRTRPAIPPFLASGLGTHSRANRHLDPAQVDASAYSKARLGTFREWHDLPVVHDPRRKTLHLLGDLLDSDSVSMVREGMANDSAPALAIHPAPRQGPTFGWGLAGTGATSAMYGPTIASCGPLSVMHDQA